MVASAAAAVTCGIHIVAGGRFVAAPLLRAMELRQVPKFTNYYCWHLVTIVIGMMAGGFLFAALKHHDSLAAFLTIQSFLFAGWSVALILIHRLSFVRFPQWLLFLLVGAAGALHFL